VPGMSSNSKGFTQPKRGNRGKTKAKRQECTCETTYMVESSSSCTQQRGTKATKGERGYFITTAEPPFHWSLFLQLRSSPNLRLHIVPMQIVTIQGDKTASLCDGFNTSQASRTDKHVHLESRRTPAQSRPHGCCNLTSSRR